MALKLYTAPVYEPFTLPQVKEFLRLPSTFTGEDDALNWFIKAARSVAESRTNRALVPQTWKLTLNKFPASGVIECNKNPLVSVSSIVYIDSDGTSQTWSSSNYIVDDQREPWRITPAYGESWPSTQPRINAVTVTFIAGYSTVEKIPYNIQQGMRLVIGDFYKHRENIVIGRMVNEIPRAAEWLFDLERIEDHHTGNYTG
jgi:uncharacterized phiE125 gp8 family phage protein